MTLDGSDIADGGGGGTVGARVSELLEATTGESEPGATGREGLKQDQERVLETPHRGEDASRDISREQHLRRVERLSSLGTLIGGVAHELNNPLTAVVGFAHLMLMDERPAEDREMLETIAREAERAAKIVADLRIVARDSQQEPPAARSAIDLNELVRHVVGVRRPLLETRGIMVSEDFAHDLPTIQASRAQLEQVVVNLLMNAEHALEGVRARPRELVLRTRPTPLGAALHVIDSGAGIRREHIDRIFDPFFTTRAPGEGTGLGLTLVHSIVTEHGGSLRVDSEPDRGTEFVIDLPGLEAT
ncbi:MAG TPA: ATP-binding protein [Longimicrobiales bacterium]|nr:ATP-binding protein [Longimicrobiales bacterium]